MTSTISSSDSTHSTHIVQDVQHFLPMSNITLDMKLLTHEQNVLHVNIKIGDIWTLKVFYYQEDCLKKYYYEIQIFRANQNVNDTPFSHRTFLYDISEVDQFINKFQKWAQLTNTVSFYDLEFIDNTAIITKIDPMCESETFTLKITRHRTDYYDIEYNLNDKFVNKIFWCKKDDVTHYMRWFTQWVTHHRTVVFLSYHECKNNPYYMWINNWLDS